MKEEDQRLKHMQEPETSLPEMKISNVTLTAMQSSITQLLHKYSSFGKLCRIIAYCYRFISKSTDNQEKDSRQIKAVQKTKF